MARYTFTLTLNDLTITLRPPAEQFQRSIMQETQVVVDEYSPNGTPLFRGISPAVGTRYQWNVVVQVTEEQALTLEAMWSEQDAASIISLKDEYEYLPPRVTPLKSFVAGSSITVATTRTTGLFEGDVRLEFPDNHKTHYGTNGSNSLQNSYKEIEFVLKEL